MPTLSGKIINRARLWYYGSGTKQKKFPHENEMSKVINGALDKLCQKHGNLECSFECSMYYSSMRSKLFSLLDAGCDTIVLSSPMTIYSHFEEFNSSFYHCFEYIHEWESRNHGKKAKVIIAPPMGHFQPLRQAFLAMLKERLSMLPENSDVAVALKVHGMPWDHFQWEAWLELAPPYRDKLFEEVEALMATFNFGRTRVVSCQDEFANPIWDPKEKYLSTNRAYKDAVRDGFDYVIGIPIEMVAENSDTLFQHAQENYHGFEGYDVYNEIDYSDWSIPYVQEITVGKTTVIYNGVPVGKYQSDVIEALFESLDSVLSRRKPC